MGNKLYGVIRKFIWKHHWLPDRIRNPVVEWMCDSCGAAKGEYTESHITYAGEKRIFLCHDCWTGHAPVKTSTWADKIFTKTGLRAAYWNEIRTRVTTHEGELLHGKAGQEYQAKFGKQYLGRDMATGKRYSADDVEAYERSQKK